MRTASCLLVSLLAGCTQLNTLVSPDPQGKVIESLAGHDYVAANSVIERTSEHHPQYALLQEQALSVETASREYRQYIQKRALALAREQEWKEAFTLLRTTASKVLEPTPLEELTATLKKKEIEQLNHELANRRLAQARAWLAHPQLVESLARYDAPEARREIEQLQAEKQLLLNDLNRLGEFYAKRYHWHKTRELLAAAHRLAPDSPPSDTLQRARRILADAQEQEDAERDRDLQKEAETLMTRYQETRQLEDLLSARTFLNEHRNNATLAKQRKLVESWCRGRFVQEMNTGEALYARGQYREAYRIWKKIKPLYPDNVELNKKLERSQRVINNLRSLGNN